MLNAIGLRMVYIALILGHLVVTSHAFFQSPTTPRILSISRHMENLPAASDTKRATTVPLTLDEMVRQAASAIKEAADLGQTRQIVRILLPRDSSSNDFGKYFETEDSLHGNMLLVPPDESWQGGIMQLYRSILPTAKTIMQTCNSAKGLPPRISEDRSVDESGVDGVGLLTTDDASISCWIQPSQEVIKNVETFATKPDGIILLLNPQWRQVDDALDSASQSNQTFLSNIASFLGGKGDTLRRLSNANFKPVYTLEGYVCRGANIRLLQVMDSDWSVFCERDNGESFIQVGTTKQRPTYQQVDELLQSNDIGYKYARDMGLQPKL